MKRTILLLIIAIVAAAAALGSESQPLTHNAEQGLPAGRLLELEFRGQPGRRLSFRLEGLAQGLILTESQPGIYQGRFMVTPSMVPYRGSLVVGDRMGTDLAESKVNLTHGSHDEVVQFIDAEGQAYVAFDRKIAADTIVMECEGASLTFPDELELHNNFFVTRKSVDTPQISAQALDLLGHSLDTEQVVVSSKYTPTDTEGVSL